MVAAGFDADPQRLEAQVYLPAREGSLQPEMLAAARRQGALALPAPTTLAGLFSEVAAGTPVIVLQNLGLAIAPRWHYAVVVGYDRRQGEVVLRSGTLKREVLPVRTFEHTWARSGHWGMMVMRPGSLPLAVDPGTLEKTLASLEKYAAPAALQAWYAEAAQRWPDRLVFLMGLGNAAYANGHLDAAEQAFRIASGRHPQNAAALNNLATVLQQRGRLADALAVAARAVALGGEWEDTARATYEAIAADIETAAELAAIGRMSGDKAAPPRAD